MLVVSGEKGSSRGHAPCAVIGGEEPHSLLGQFVDGRRPHPGIGFLVRTDRAVGMIIGVDEQNVGALRRCSAGRAGGCGGSGEEASNISLRLCLLCISIARSFSIPALYRKREGAVIRV